MCVQIVMTYLNKTQAGGQNAEIPWDTLRYLIGNVMYGGRVIDNYDQRIVNTFMEEYFGEFIVENFHPFFFYRDQNVQYRLPPVGGKEDYLSKHDRNTVFVFELHGRRLF